MALPPSLADTVTDLARAVRLDEAEAELVNWWSSTSRDELLASEPEIEALVAQSFLPKRRRRLLVTLRAQLASSPSVVPIPAEPQPEPEVRAPHPLDADDRSIASQPPAQTNQQVLDEVGELNRKADPRGAEELFRTWLSKAADDDLTSLEPEVRALLNKFLPKRHIALTDAYDQRIARIPAAGHREPESPASSETHLPIRTPPPPAADIPAPDLPISRDESIASQPPAQTNQQVLEEVGELNRKADPQGAEELFRTWLSRAADDDLTSLEPEVRALLNKFLRKRHIALTDAYNQRLSRIRAAEHRQAESPASAETHLPVLTRSQLHTQGPTDSYDEEFRNYVISRLDERLIELSERHIFQWNTHYRDTVTEFFEPFMGFLDDEPPRSPAVSPVAELLGDRFRRHAKEIFEKGWIHMRAWTDASTAQAKAENGIQRFLDLPLEVYSAKLALLQDGISARSLRMISSAMLSGILRGVATANLGGQSGTLLPRIHRTWARALPFITASDLDLLLKDLHDGQMHVGIRTSLFPFAQAIDDLLLEDPERAPLPRMSDYAFQQRRITTTLQAPTLAGSNGLLEIQICLSQGHVDRETLDGAYSEAATAVLAPFVADLRAYADSRDALRAIAVPTIGLSDGDDPTSRNPPLKAVAKRCCICSTPHRF